MVSRQSRNTLVLLRRSYSYQLATRCTKLEVCYHRQLIFVGTIYSQSKCILFLKAIGERLSSMGDLTRWVYLNTYTLSSILISGNQNDAASERLKPRFLQNYNKQYQASEIIFSSSVDPNSVPTGAHASPRLN
jgi:hypothetical protein